MGRGAVEREQVDNPIPTWPADRASRPVSACHICPRWHAVNPLVRKGFPGPVPRCHTQPGEAEAGTPLGPSSPLRHIFYPTWRPSNLLKNMDLTGQSASSPACKGTLGWGANGLHFACEFCLLRPSRREQRRGFGQAVGIVALSSGGTSREKVVTKSAYLRGVVAYVTRHSASRPAGPRWQEPAWLRLARSLAREP
jgi:hypothetical protein